MNAEKARKWRNAVLFMRWQASLLVFCIIVYASLHVFITPGSTFPKASNLLQLDRFGRMTVISAEDIDWYVGADKSVPLLTQINERNKNIETRLGSLHQELQDLTSQFVEEVGGPIRDAANKGQYSLAVKHLTEAFASLSPDSLAAGNLLVIKQVEETLRQLAELKSSQEESLPLLGQPEKFKLFWVNPWGVLAEVVAWSLFGLFSSLLFHSAHYARKGKFKYSETVVGWTKIFYTPVIAIVLVVAVGDGLLHVNSAGARIWMIPLFGFLAGFSSRKAAKVVDGLSEWMLGRMARSLQANEDTTTSPSVAAIQQAISPPRNFNDLEDQAKGVLATTLREKLIPLQKTS